MEQHYPKEAPPKKKYTQEYEQPTLKDRNRDYKPKPQPKQNYRQSYEEDYHMQRGGNDYEDKNIKEVNRENRVEIREYNPSEFR